MDDTGQPTLQPTDSVQQHVSAVLFNSTFSKWLYNAITLLNNIWKHLQHFYTIAHFINLLWYRIVGCFKNEDVYFVVTNNIYV